MTRSNQSLTSVVGPHRTERGHSTHGIGQVSLGSLSDVDLEFGLSFSSILLDGLSRGLFGVDVHVLLVQAST